MAEESATKTVLVDAAAADAFTRSLLEKSGVSAANAAIVARGLVQADLRGVESHGINRLPSYLARVRNGVLDAKAEPTVKHVTPVVAQVSEGPSTCY
jgi:LDH2 family malate/lactate/ureidoglycolate dehydrogenase